MNHQPFEEWLLSEKPLDPKEKLELELHLRMCSSCNALVETGTALRTAKMVSPAAGFTARFHGRLALQKAAERRRRAWGSVWFAVAGLVILIWLTAPYLGAFLASPSTWIAAFIGWIVFLTSTVMAIAQAGSVVLDVVPTFLAPLIWMVAASALAGMVLLWSVSIWRFAHRSVPRGV